MNFDNLTTGVFIAAGAGSEGVNNFTTSKWGRMGVDNLFRAGSLKIPKKPAAGEEKTQYTC